MHTCDNVAHIVVFEMMGRKLTLKIMPRKRITLSIDDTLIDAAKRAAHSQNNSLSRFVESLIADKAIELGEVSEDYMTPGETRGRKSGDDEDD